MSVIAHEALKMSPHSRYETLKSLIRLDDVQYYPCLQQEFPYHVKVSFLPR